jgi:hypothetical protein
LSNPDKFYTQRKEQFDHLPGDVLLSLAKNENAEWRWRKAAVEIMLDHKFKQSSHPDVAEILRDVLADREAHQEVRDIVETAIEGPIQAEDEDKTNLGPLFCGVTTENL